MNGAESLVRTLLASDVDVCFANPGTSEMHFVAALDRVDGMRCILGLFEGVVTGAADGYARMAERVGNSNHRSSLDCWYRPGLYPEVEGRERGLESLGRRRLTGPGCQADVPSAAFLQPRNRPDSYPPIRVASV